MNRRTIHKTCFCLVIPALVISCYSGGSGGDGGEGGAPCLKDTDCKGERVCLAGLCSGLEGGQVSTEATGEPTGGEGPTGDPGGEGPGGGSGSSCREVAGVMICVQTEDPGPSMMEMAYGTVPAPPGVLPASASLPMSGFTVPNQGSCGSCVAFAVRSGMALRAIAQTQEFVDFSPAHIWHIAGYGADDCDTGSSIWTVADSNDAKATHVVRESTWPYDPKDPVASLDDVPSASALSDGGIAYIDDFAAVSLGDVMELKYALAQNWPPVIGVPVYFDDWDDGDVGLPADPNAEPDGYHAITVVGYDDATSTFKFVNSWGMGFGDGGYGTLSYDFVDQHSVGGVAVQKLAYGDDDVPVCGDGTCEGEETQADCCVDCGCPAGQGCSGGQCVEDSPCGNGSIDPGEQCEGNDLGGATCSSIDFDGGELGCKADCTFNTSGCCSDECTGGQQCLDSSTVQTCGNFDGDACNEYGDQQVCSDGQECSGGACGCPGGNEGQFTIVNPGWGSPGCAGDGTLKLKAAGEMISPTKLRMKVRKEDDTAFGAAATLTLYVGEPIKCPNPPNVKKANQALDVGAVEQTIDLSLNPYDGAWAAGETKKFWIGKDEAGMESFRATGMVSVRRNCIP